MKHVLRHLIRHLIWRLARAIVPVAAIAVVLLGNGATKVHAEQRCSWQGNVFTCSDPMTGRETQRCERRGNQLICTQ